MTIYTVLGPVGAPSIPPYGLHNTSTPFAGKPPFNPNAVTYTVMGPAGAPSRPPYHFVAKPPFNPSPHSGNFTVMGPAGAPSIPPYGLGHTSNPFGGKPPFVQTAFFTVSGSEVKDRFPTNSVCYNYAGPFGVPSNDSRRTN